MGAKKYAYVNYKMLVWARSETPFGTTSDVANHISGFRSEVIDKWERGKCMPDYSIVKSLCEELEVTVAELLDGEKAEDKSVRIYDDEQMLDLLRRTQELEKQKVMLTGLILIVMGIAFQALSYTLGGSDFKDFLSGLLLGLSIAEMLVGVYVVGKSLTGR